MQSCKSVLEEALPGFREASGGRRNGGDWRAGLTESSKWDEIFNEASYHLLTPDTSGMAFSERMAGLSHQLAAKVTALQEAHSTSVACAAVGATTAGVTALEEECKALVVSAEAAIMNARVVDTEAFFCQVLSTSRTTGKLRHRIAHMARKGLDCSAIHPVVWARVMLPAGA